MEVAQQFMTVLDEAVWVLWGIAFVLVVIAFKVYSIEKMMRRGSTVRIAVAQPASIDEQMADVV